MNDNSILQIFFLGKIRFVFDGKDISHEIGSKTAALAALLLLHRKGIRRERLIAYLWPNSGEEASRYNLRYNLWQLKKAVGTDGQGRSFLNIEKEYCSVNFEYDFWCDVLEAESGELLLHSGTERLQQVCESCSGDFFEGSYFNGCDDFNEFIILQRNNLENRRVKLLKRLADLYEESGNFPACLEVLTEILNVEPYDETTALKIMTIYTACGNRSAAIRYYKAFSSKLICNLGIQPSEELKEKYNEIRYSVNDGTVRAAVIQTWCMRGVPYFWVADVTETLFQRGLAGEQMALQKSELWDLACLVPSIAAYCGAESIDDIPSSLPEVRIVRSFLHLLESACTRQPITLVVNRGDEMDDSSKGVLEYLKERKIEGLELA